MKKIILRCFFFSTIFLLMSASTLMGQKKLLSCNGKKYLLNTNTIIYEDANGEWLEIGDSAKDILCENNQLIAILMDNMRLKYSGIPKVWEPLKKIASNIDQRKVQALLDEGEAPITLYRAGVQLEKIYGKLYEGGYIFYLNPSNGKGMVAASLDAEKMLSWTGAKGYCSALQLNGKSDWILPSKDELNQLFMNLSSQGIGGIFHTSWYWSGTKDQNRLEEVWYQNMKTGDQAKGNQLNPKRVRAIRYF